MNDFCFQFHDRLHLRELTGINAVTLPALLHHIKTVPESIIFNHTHRCLEQHERLVPDYPNDFSYWVGEVLGEDYLGERLASIDIMSALSIDDVRNELVFIIDDTLQKIPALAIKMAPQGEAFYFMKTKSVVFKLPYSVSNCDEFISCLKQIPLTSLYYHIFESRLRLQKPVNDVSLWLSDCCNQPELAASIAKLNPYDYSLEALREKVIALVKESINPNGGVA